MKIGMVGLGRMGANMSLRAARVVRVGLDDRRHMLGGNGCLLLGRPAARHFGGGERERERQPRGCEGRRSCVHGPRRLAHPAP